MERLFNIAGPCLPSEHYLLPTLERCPEVERLVETKQYFVVHAARQSGKTTLLNAFEAEINGGSERVAVYCSLESAQGLTDPRDGIPAILNCLASAVKTASWKLPLPPFEVEPFQGAMNTAVKMALGDFCQRIGKPLVLLFDEADCLSEQTLITFLRQLRDGFVNRERAPFPSSIALVGMRNIRDYKAKIRADGETLGSASPFNVITKALTLHSFTRDEVASLYGQHTTETGQVFEEEAIDRAFHWTRGQPWLVNAVARECVEELLNRDFSKPVTAGLVEQAAENLMQRRDTHLDSLYERLKEERVRRVVEPVITGSEGMVDRNSDDCQYVLDLGILRSEGGSLLPSNPIYAEVVARTLSYNSQEDFKIRFERTPWATEGRLDMSGLLRAFQEFWRENSEAWVERFQYREAAPHLILMAFLQRVVNGGGQIVREYSLGRRRVDLCVHYAGKRYPVELKLLAGPKTRQEGVGQLSAYCDLCGVDEGWLVIFDRDPERPWDDKISWDTLRDAAGRQLHIVGC